MLKDNKGKNKEFTEIALDLNCNTLPTIVDR